MLAQGLELGEKYALDGTHQGSALSCEVRIYLTLEVGLEEVAGSNGYAEGEGAFERTARSILVHGVG